MKCPYHAKRQKCLCVARDHDYDLRNEQMLSSLHEKPTKRMRKERPTMRIESETAIAVMHATNEILAAAFTSQAPVFLAPIRCTATPPCGHCWYCGQAARP